MMKTKPKVNYLLESSDSWQENERLADGKWRLHSGEQWKMHLNTREQVVHIAKGLKGAWIGQAHWSEEKRINTYRHVEYIE